MKQISTKTNAMKQVETKIGGDIEEILRVLYVDKDLSVSKINEILGTSYVTTLKWLELAGIHSRRLKVDSDT